MKQHATFKKTTCREKRHISPSIIREQVRLLKGVNDEQVEIATAFIYQKLATQGLIPPQESTSDTKDSATIKSLDFDIYVVGLPPWLVNNLEILYENVFNPQYKVCWENQSNELLDFVLAYETKSGLVDVLVTKVFPNSTGCIYACPCWDMKSYAWSAWTQDDYELGRSPTVTPEQVNAQESVYKECEDTWEVRVIYG